MDFGQSHLDFLHSVFNLIPSDTSEESLDQKCMSKRSWKKKRRESLDDGGKSKKMRMEEDASDGHVSSHRVQNICRDGHGAQSEYDAAGQGSSPTQLHHKIQQRINDFKGKRNKMSREDILARRRERKSKKKKSQKIKRLNTTRMDSSTNEQAKIKPTEKRKPTFNKDGKLVFSKFDFSEDKQKKKRSISGLVGRDYKKILQTLEKRKEKIENLKAEDANAALELSKRDAYNTAISKAQGLKVKDDPALVTKSLKRKEKRENKSKTLWKQREDTVKKQMKEKQEKRTRNLKARTQQKIEGKVKRSKKKSRVAGF